MLPVTHILTFTLALLCYGSAIWGGVRFFRVSDAGAARGKRLIAAVVVPSQVAGVWLIWHASPQPWPFALLSQACFVASLLLFWWAIHANRLQPLAFAGADGQPERLVMHGPYACIRHPFYTSYLLGWLGLILYTPCLFSGGILLLMGVLYRHQAIKEERLILQSPLAAEYRAYMLACGRFWPGRG